MFTEEKFKFEGYSGCFGCRVPIHKRATATGGISAQRTAIAKIYAQMESALTPFNSQSPLDYPRVSPAPQFTGYM
jgi:hypothetical protein